MVTKQKFEVVFRVPMSAANVVMEILDRVQFTDPVFTDNGNKQGWITQIELIPKEHQLKITCLLKPDVWYSGAMVDDRYIEVGVGNTDDTVTEVGEGNTSDTVTEIGV
jgi:hypothetical protein